MKLFNAAKNYGSTAVARTAAAGTTLMLMAGAAMAADGDTGFDAFLDAVNLGGLSAKVIAVGLLIVGIALAFKGPDIAKRVIRKV